MEGVVARETGWPGPGGRDLRDGKNSVIVFPLAECPECEQPAEAEEEVADQDLSLEDEIDVTCDFREIVGSNTRLKAVLDNVRIVAPTDSFVLILGETGTGKELIARAIHDLSPRKNFPFVKVNCAAIPSGLLESELFGHERGAFTGAIAQKVGRFELANKGTLFLDEVGDIPLELQPKLLRVLQEQEFERLGSTRTQRVDVRVVAATNADLATMVAEKKFRCDLYYRLNVVPIVVPPLRERRDDIERLVRHFARKFAQRMGKRITSVPRATMAVLTRHTWPGNVRELQNVIERSVILNSGHVLSVDELWLSKEVLPPRVQSPSFTDEECEEREIIQAALAVSKGRVAGPNGAASKLGIPQSTLAHKIKVLGIRKSRYRFQ